MPPNRRTLLAAPLLLAAPALFAPDTAPRAEAPLLAVKLKPDEDEVAFQFDLRPQETMLGFDGFTEVFRFPGEARPLAKLPIAGRQLLSVGFDADALAGVKQRLAALVGWDGRALRVLDIEILSFSAASLTAKRSLIGRIAATADRRFLRVVFDAAELSVPGPRARRESWATLLAWRSDSILLDVSPHRGRPGSWQARMEEARDKVAALLRPSPRTTITLDMLGPTGLLDPFGR
ncbi:MAG TPA: hypothetical protein VME92_09405 [Acetobacteraceae bacterium]|nr:hypothetical protein [Acetobacteraceae bacterium]